MQIIIRYTSLLLLVQLSTLCYAQNGGDGVFKFLNLPNSAKMAALGGVFPVLNSVDISSSYQNPSLLNKDNNGKIGLNYSNYISDINFGSLQYNFQIKNNNLSTTLLYINYGDFHEADASGNLTGNSFTGGDYLLNIGYGNNWDNKIFYGVNLKTIHGAYDIYRSFAIAADISATYKDSVSNLATGIIIRNLGYQLKPFFNQREELPFEVAVTLSQKLKHAPFKYHVTYRNLQKFDLSYSDFNSLNNQNDLFEEDRQEKAKFGSKLLTHFILGTELLLSESLNFQASYNFQRSKELSIPNAGGLPGFSAGFSINLKKLSFSYAHSRLNVAGGNNYFSVQLQPSAFLK